MTALQHGPMSVLVRGQLSAMMFLQYFIWGAWYVTMTTYLGATLRFDGAQIGLAYGTTAVAAVVSPVFVGMIADRFFATEKILALLHVAGGLLLYRASTAATFGSFYLALLGHTLCYMPTLALTNSLSFHHMDDPGREFPRVRVLGTIGWIVVGLVVGRLGLEASAVPFRIGAGASLVMALFCLTLPHTPPRAGRTRATVGSVFGLEAVRLLRDRSFAVFVASALLICIPLSFYYAFANAFLNEVGIPEPASKMTLGQMSEIGFMVVMPWFFARLGVKRMLVVGMLCWALRYALFAGGDAGARAWMLYGGIVLHGICYDFFFVTGQIYVDRVAPPRIRAAAQGLLTLATLGVGMFVGSWLSGAIVAGHAVPAAGGGITHDWRAIWLVPAAASALILVVFALAFHHRDESVTSDVTL